MAFWEWEIFSNSDHLTLKIEKSEWPHALPRPRCIVSPLVFLTAAAPPSLPARKTCWATSLRLPILFTAAAAADVVVVAMSTRRPPHYCIPIPASLSLSFLPPLSPLPRRPVWHQAVRSPRPRRGSLRSICIASIKSSRGAAPSLKRRENYVLASLYLSTDDDRSRPGRERESLKIPKVGNFAEAEIKVPKWPRKWPQFDYTPSNNNFRRRRRRRRRRTFLPLSLFLFVRSLARSFFPPLFLT